MIAYKGLNAEMVASLGRGRKKLEPGIRYVEEQSKTMRCGWHCTEDPFACLTWFPLGQGNHYFQVEAGGSIDEDESERIACTELTLLKELTLKELAGYGMMYMVEHPNRTGWERNQMQLCVAKERAEANKAGHIAIARGQYPMVCGKEGSILGLILEPEPGNIIAAKLFVPNGQQSDHWYTLHKEGLEECDEKKTA